MARFFSQNQVKLANPSGVESPKYNGILEQQKLAVRNMIQCLQVLKLSSVQITFVSAEVLSCTCCRSNFQAMLIVFIFNLFDALHSV